MDRLLTDEELKPRFIEDPTYDDHDPPGRDHSHWDVVGVTKDQDAKSIRIDRQAAAEWWTDLCDNREHGNEIVSHGDCPICIEELFAGFREGKAPWEAD